MFHLLRAKSAPASFNITIAHREGKSLARWPIAVARRSSRRDGNDRVTSAEISRQARDHAV